MTSPQAHLVQGDWNKCRSAPDPASLGCFPDESRVWPGQPRCSDQWVIQNTPLVMNGWSEMRNVVQTSKLPLLQWFFTTLIMTILRSMTYTGEPVLLHTYTQKAKPSPNYLIFTSYNVFWSFKFIFLKSCLSLQINFITFCWGGTLLLSNTGRDSGTGCLLVICTTSCWGPHVCSC